MKTRTYPEYEYRARSGTLGAGTLEYALLVEGAEFEAGHTTEAEATVTELNNGGNYARAASAAVVKKDDLAVPPNVILTGEDGSGSDTPKISWGTLTGADTNIHAILVLWRVTATDERIPAIFIGSSQGVPDFPIIVGDSVVEETSFTIPITGLVLNALL